jgi:hypothetical protein
LAFSGQRPYSSSSSTSKSKAHGPIVLGGATPIILGGAQLKVGTSGMPKQADKGSEPIVSSSSVTHMMVAFLIPFGLVMVAIRVNPKLRERLPCGGGARHVPPGLTGVRSGDLTAVRPRQRGAGPVYDRIAAIEPAPLSADEEQPPVLSDTEVTPKPRPKQEPKSRTKPATDHGSKSQQSQPTVEAEASTPAALLETPPPEAAHTTPAFTPGMQVRVHGLQGAREHNGKEGVLIAPVATQANGIRWNLRLLTGELLALKPENLQRCGGRAAPSILAMVEALERAGEHEKADMLRTVMPDDS